MLDKIFEDIGVIKGGVIQPLFLRTMYKNEIALKLLSKWPGDSPKEQIYCMVNNIKERPLCSCGNTTKFINVVEGYRQHCSYACANNSSTTKQKYKEHMLNTYGVEHYSQTDEYKKKFKKTCLERFGVENPNSSKRIKEKKKEIFQKRYGCENAFTIPEIRERTTKKMLRSFYDSLSSGRLKGRINPLFSFEEYEGIDKKYMWKCCECGTEFEDHIKFGKIPLCPSCFGNTGKSCVEKDVVEWLRSLGLKPLENYRKLIPPKEVDIFFPEKKLAIEINGVYWHGEGSLGKEYHVNKMKACAEKGVRLIQIWDEEWYHKEDIIKSLLAAALGLPQKRIYARKTRIKEVDSKTAKAFMEDNHLQGYVPSSVRLGLFYQRELVSLLTVAKPRFNKQYDWEITRFASKKGYRVAGGFSKLLSAFRKSRSGNIFTYSDARLFSGNVYKQAGFKSLGLSSPGYSYAPLNRHRATLESRYQFQKHKQKDFDPALTEWENMQLRGYDRVWDCGNWKFVLE